MFALRKITGNGSELNFDLGDYYVLITKERSPEEFEDKLMAISFIGGVATGWYAKFIKDKYFPKN